MKQSIFTIARISQKATFLLFVMMVCVLITPACTSDLEDLESTNKLTETVSSVSSNITKEEALNLANKVLQKNYTKGTVSDMPTVDYVTRDPLTKSVEGTDTLAYILNYPDNGGFVIVSKTRKVFPILAYSDEGSFNISNENAKKGFIDKIGYYVDSSSNDDLYDIDTDFKVGCYVVNPMIQTTLSQYDPWNKYVVKEHPGCPAGCLAIATALAMTHSKYNIYYHNSTFYLKSIVNAINKKQTGKTNVRARIENGEGPYVPTYTYEQAVDSMAKLIYWIGKDLGTEYSIQESSATFDKVYPLCYSLKYTIPFRYKAFNMDEIVQYIKDNYIIIMCGTDNRHYPAPASHAWVADACSYCVDPVDSSIIYNTLIHCDWGWGGYCNGYFSSKVFSVDEYNFVGTAYIPIKKEY